MSTGTSQENKGRKALSSARFACLFFGFSMLAAGLAPLVIQRLVSGSATGMMLSQSSMTLIMGGVLVGLGVAIGRGIRWAMFTALGLSLVILAGAIMVIHFSGARVMTIYPLLLSTCTAGTCWLAIIASRERDEQPAEPADGAA